jgi:hypothetical protein
MKCKASTNSKASEQQTDNKSMFIYFGNKTEPKSRKKDTEPAEAKS